MVETFDVTADPDRFLMVKSEAEEATPLQIVVVPGFLEEAKARLAAKR
jgi:hypothetical protein